MTGSYKGKSLVLLDSYKSISITDCIFFHFPYVFYVDKGSPDKSVRETRGSGVVSRTCNAEQDLSVGVLVM